MGEIERKKKKNPRKSIRKRKSSFTHGLASGHGFSFVSYFCAIVLVPFPLYDMSQQK